MQTTLNHTIAATYTETSVKTSLWTRFMNYAKGQEKNRLLWIGIILGAHGCILTPLVAMLSLIAGPNFFLFMTGMMAMGIALVTNLAAMPTKITIPAFVLTVLVDIAIVISCVVLIAA